MKTIFLSLLVAFPFINFAQDDIKKVTSTVAKSEIEGHIYFLASDELKGRQTGTPENKIAAQYLANMLRGYGVKPVTENKSYFQKVTLNSTSSFANASLKIGDFTTSKIVTIKKGNTSFSGALVFANYGLAEDYNTLDVKGKIVVTYSGTKDNSNLRFAFSKVQEKIVLAKEKGAVGIIEVNSIDDRTWSQLDHSFNGEKMSISGEEEPNNFTYLWINDQKEEISKFFEDKNEIKATVEVQGIKKSKVVSQNVVGMVEGTDPKLKDEFVIYSAHYDHVGIGKAIDNDSIYNGARDNAVGTVTVLSAAQNIAKYPTKRSALFILFTGEEKGLLGSKWYVNHPMIPLDQMVYCFNSDNGGYNDTSIATIVGLKRTTAAEDIKKAATPFGLKAIDDPAPEQGLFDRSDNVHFAAKGIPAPTFSMGFTAFDEEITKYYHQVTDNPDTLDYDYLLKFFQSYVLACRNIANNPETPFWVEGDKYYEAGKKLYNKNR
ncbi:aminopeptidase [Aquimarina sp. BL5]|uniref:M28 family peptidase n=1 Tax=Aquimarina sp. BL5 TaxID=1714860 RepID=UPI000E48DD74|nr:M28 family peptidase [Aquimarina sp. BL5]AXT50573.1 aminopeptidase [Aquimarina sp. BL5]RKN02920.1 M28 family peptidase [Aquimarina sp. BL5]